MIRKITFKNTNVSLFQVNTDAPLEIESYDNITNISNMILTPKGDNLDKNLIILTGDFLNSSIEIKSSCTLQSNPTFLCTTPIKLDPSSSDTIIIMGNFKNTAGVTVLVPSTIVSGTNVQLEKLTLAINYKTPSENNLNIVGDFSSCTTLINSPSTITLNGIIGETIVGDNIVGTNLNLIPGSIVNNMIARSKTLVAGDKVSVDALLSNTTEGLYNIIPLYNTFVVDFLNGSSLIPLNITNTGKYKITCIVMDDSIEHQLPQSINVEVI